MSERSMKVSRRTFLRTGAAGAAAAAGTLAMPGVLAGALLAASSFGWPLVVGGGLKLAYDAALFAAFRRRDPSR